MVRINKTGQTYVIAFTPETKRERELLSQILDLEKEFKRSAEEEKEYWTVKPKAKKDGFQLTADVSFSDEDMEKLMEEMPFK